MDDVSRVRQRFAEAGIPWLPALDQLVIDAPEFINAFLDFSIATATHSELAPKDRQLIQMALAVSSTHLDRDGAAFHIREAARLGATREELVQVCQFSTLLGIHTMPMALAVLVEEAARAGHELREAAGDQADRARARFIADRGVLPDDLEPLARLDPQFIDAYRELSRVVVAVGVLDPKLVELIIIALDVSTTHLFGTGARLHVRRAFELGATVGEILEVFELTSGLGISGTALGIQLVAEAFPTPDPADRVPS